MRVATVLTMLLGAAVLGGCECNAEQGVNMLDQVSDPASELRAFRAIWEQRPRPQFEFLGADGTPATGTGWETRVKTIRFTWPADDSGQRPVVEHELIDPKNVFILLMEE